MLKNAVLRELRDRFHSVSDDSLLHEYSFDLIDKKNSSEMPISCYLYSS